MSGLDASQIIGLGLQILILALVGSLVLLVWRRMTRLGNSIQSLGAATTNLHTLVNVPTPPVPAPVGQDLAPTVDAIRAALLSDLEEADRRGQAGGQAFRNWATLRAAAAISYSYKRAENRESNDITVAGIGAISDLTTSGFQSLILINGGAVVAFITLIGAVWAGGKDVIAKAMMNEAVGGLLSFGGGLAFAILGIGLAFLAQVAYQSRDNQRGNSLRIAAFVAGVASLAGFGYGAWDVAGALS